MADKAMNATQQTEHEKRVAQEEAQRSGRVVPEAEETDVEETSYEEEVEAERSGTTADEVEREEEEEPKGEAARWFTG